MSVEAMVPWVGTKRCDMLHRESHLLHLAQNDMLWGVASNCVGMQDFKRRDFFSDLGLRDLEDLALWT